MEHVFFSTRTLSPAPFLINRGGITIMAKCSQQTLSASAGGKNNLLPLPHTLFELRERCMSAVEATLAIAPASCVKLPDNVGQGGEAVESPQDTPRDSQLTPEVSAGDGVAGAARGYGDAHDCGQHVLVVLSVVVGVLLRPAVAGRPVNVVGGARLNRYGSTSRGKT